MYQTLMNSPLTLVFLLGLGFLGILIHNVNKLDKLNRENNGMVEWKKYFALERFTIILSVLLVIAFVSLSQEIKQLQQAGKWLGFGCLTVGYFAQSILASYNTRVGKYIENLGKKEDKTP